MPKSKLCKIAHILIGRKIHETGWFGRWDEGLPRATGRRNR
jgi:hypothetical protein